MDRERIENRLRNKKIILGVWIAFTACMIITGCGKQETARSEIVSEVLENGETVREHVPGEEADVPAAGGNLQGGQVDVQAERTNAAGNMQSKKTNTSAKKENLPVEKADVGAKEENTQSEKTDVPTEEDSTGGGTTNVPAVKPDVSEERNPATTESTGNSVTSGTTQTSHTCVWDGGMVTTAATCGTDGTQTYTCTTCGKTRTESIAKTGAHNFQKRYWPAEPTCTVGGYYNIVCTVCGEHNGAGDDPPKGHTIGSSEEIRHGNCVEQTVINHYCGDCGELVRQDAYTEFDQHEWEDSTFPELNMEIGAWEDVTRTFCRYCHREKLE